MKSVILYRRDYHKNPIVDGELEVAQKYFNCVEQRSEVPPGALVICRYSSLPYFEELERAVQNAGGKLINSYRQHRWIANFDYYDEIKDFTFPTWSEEQFADCEYDGPVVVKGRTNSKKHEWNSLMYAANRADALAISNELRKDPLVGQQGLIYRKYVPLKTFEIGATGLRFTNEFRFFMFKDKTLSHGYYWSEARDTSLGKIDPDAFELIDSVSKICSKRVNFYVIDIAEKESGGWLVVELNDGSMSGLSKCDPEELYNNLRSALDS